MKRLIEGAGGHRLGARAQELVRAMGGPTPESPERARRVRRSLDAPVRGAPRWAWRVALAVGLLGVSAAAAAGGTALSNAFGSKLEVPVEHAPAPAQRPAPRPRPEVARVEPTAVVEVPSNERVSPSAQGAALAAPRPALTAPQSDVARVHEAAKALRHDGDPERALQLLERAGTRSGPLAEEALALRIEAALAKGDGRQAKLAAQYLTQYPNGRYRELAKKALAGRQQ
jgi:hypothetical protein